MRSIDLSLYADRLAGEAASLAARIERAARSALTTVAVERLEGIGLLRTRGDPVALAELEETLDALEALEAWVEEALARCQTPPADARRREADVAQPRPAALTSAVPRRGVSAIRSPPSES
jgi:uncharacterized protein with PIN domain